MSKKLIFVILVNLMAMLPVLGTTVIYPNDDVRTTLEGQNRELSVKNTRWSYSWLEFTFGSKPATHAEIKLYQTEHNVIGEWEVVFRAKEADINEETFKYDDYMTWPEVGSIDGVDNSVKFYTLDITDFYNANLGKTITFSLAPRTNVSMQYGVVFNDRQGHKASVPEHSPMLIVEETADSQDPDSSKKTVVIYPNDDLRTKLVGQNTKLSVKNTEVMYSWIEFTFGSKPAKYAEIKLYQTEHNVTGEWEIVFRAKEMDINQEGFIDADYQLWPEVGSIPGVDKSVKFYTLDITDFYNANLGKTVTFNLAPRTNVSMQYGVVFNDSEGTSATVPEHSPMLIVEEAPDSPKCTKEIFPNDDMRTIVGEGQNRELSVKHTEMVYSWLEFTFGSKPAEHAEIKLYQTEHNAVDTWEVVFRAKELDIDEETFKDADYTIWPEVGSIPGVDKSVKFYTLDITDFYNANLGKTITFNLAPRTNVSMQYGVVFNDSEGNKASVPEHSPKLIVEESVDSSFQRSGTVGKWRRYVVTLDNSTYSGNPFELEVEATFTHTITGTQLTLPGYYDGDNQWKIGFMPTQLGKWTYVTSSSDPDLNKQTGSINCVHSGLPGLLKSDLNHPKKWKYSDGLYAVPIILRSKLIQEDADVSVITHVADFMAENNLAMLNFSCTDQNGYGGRHDYFFSGDWKNHKFDLPIWQRLNERLDILSARGLGVHIFLYDDDEGTPGWRGQSATECMVIRWVVARTCGYPVVLYNSGIDISEFRSGADLDWMGQRYAEFDPYKHPRSSRYDVPNTKYSMANRTYDSWWAPQQAYVDPMIKHWGNISHPGTNDDAYGENRGSHKNKDHTAPDIRRAFWKSLIAGGQGGQIRGGGDGLPVNGFYSLHHVESDLESEQWLKYIYTFIEVYLGGTYGEMAPVSSLADNARKQYAIADSSRIKILYWKTSSSDTYDPYTCDKMNVKLSGISNSITYSVKWFDPRAGTTMDAEALTGGSDYSLTPPSSQADDWVLLLSMD